MSIGRVSHHCLSSLLLVLAVLLAATICSGLGAVTHQGKRFGSTVYDSPKMVSQRELYLSTRTSFESPDLLEEVLKGAQRKSKLGKVRGARLTYAFGALSVYSLFALPGLDVDASVKNVFGLAALSAPFGSLLLQQYGSELLQKDYTASDKDSNSKERICYHEAGHFLVGYLAGLATDDYRIDGEYDSGLSIASQGDVILGNVLMCAMAGTVAETLRFGDNTGGAADVSLALEALRNSNIKKRDEINSFLRFGLLKSLTLLRLYRDALDDIAAKMSEDASIFELVRIIEAHELD